MGTHLSGRTRNHGHVELDLNGGSFLQGMCNTVVPSAVTTFVAVVDKRSLPTTTFCATWNSRIRGPDLNRFPLSVVVLPTPQSSGHAAHPCFERSSDQLMRSPISKTCPSRITPFASSLIPHPSLSYPTTRWPAGIFRWSLDRLSR